MSYTTQLLPFDYELSKDRLYGVWRGMLMRCYNTNATAYHRYGGRGINVCDGWRLDFQAFKDWALAAGYDYAKDRREQTIDRIDNNGNYEPDNCRWVSIAENNRNRERSGPIPKPKPKPEPKEPKRKLAMWEINGVSKPARDWCKEYDISYSSVMRRMRQNGMTLIEALTTEKVKYTYVKYYWRKAKSNPSAVKTNELL